MFEGKSVILLVAGLFFFAIAFLGNAVVPMAMYHNVPELTVAELVTPQLCDQFEDLSIRYPEQFAKYIGAPTEENCAKSLALGRKLYVGEACWHCHSQFVRPVSRESQRWGPVAKSSEYQNELQRPVLFGTRRVGPDLSRESLRRSNDWHAVHFFRPKTTSPYSVMPEYPWLFDGAADKPNERGIALILYMQWLGSWHPSFPYFEAFDKAGDRPWPGTKEPK